jgi:hypothetical protein
MDAIAKPQCEYCGDYFPDKERGRPQRFCSDRCRQAHRKSGSAPENGLGYRTGRVKPESASKAFETASEFKPENLYPKTSPLSSERINDWTFKITNGELTNVPASHGQWGGYRTTKAMAWIIKIGPNAWLARCADRVCGPSSFNEAKGKAVALAKGAEGDYFVRNPIAHLNGLCARLIERDEEAGDE